MGTITTAFIESDGIFGCVGRGCGTGHRVGDHVGPLGIEGGEGRDVLLPGFYSVGEKVFHGIVVIVKIFVGKSAETMTELMNDNGPEKAVAGSSESVEIIYASAAIFVGVGKDDDVFVREIG